MSIFSPFWVCSSVVKKTLSKIISFVKNSLLIQKHRFEPWLYSLTLYYHLMYHCTVWTKTAVLCSFPFSLVVDFEDTINHDKHKLGEIIKMSLWERLYLSGEETLARIKLKSNKSQSHNQSCLVEEMTLDMNTLNQPLFFHKTTYCKFYWSVPSLRSDSLKRFWVFFLHQRLFILRLTFLVLAEGHAAKWCRGWCLLLITRRMALLFLANCMLWFAAGTLPFGEIRAYDCDIQR